MRCLKKKATCHCLLIVLSIKSFRTFKTAVVLIVPDTEWELREYMLTDRS